MFPSVVSPPEKREAVSDGLTDLPSVLTDCPPPYICSKEQQNVYGKTNNAGTDCTVRRVAPGVEYIHLKSCVFLMAQIIHILVLFH